MFIALVLSFIHNVQFNWFILCYSSYLLYYNCSTDIQIHEVKVRGPYCEYVSIEHSYCTCR